MNPALVAIADSIERHLEPRYIVQCSKSGQYYRRPISARSWLLTDRGSADQFKSYEAAYEIAQKLGPWFIVLRHGGEQRELGL